MKRKHVKITTKSYGGHWRNVKVYYTGGKPNLLKDDGRFTSGKSILESLEAVFKKFTLTLIPGKSRVTRKGKSFQIFLSTHELSKMNSGLISRKKDVTQSAINATFSVLFPKYFKGGTRLFSYQPGLFAGILESHFMPTRLSKEDRTAFNTFIPKFIASGVGKGGTAVKFKAGVELKVLQPLAKDLAKRIHGDRSESTWQDYLKTNILLIQQGYIELITKANIGVMVSSFPDFLLVTYDGYLDILEIKTPFTSLLQHDKAHNNYYWTADVSKAIAQVENYLQAVSELGDKVRNTAKDKYGIDLRVIKPRGIIFAGNSSQFANDKAIQDDFRLLNQGLKNITVVPYDELLTRLQNYITVLTGLRSKAT
jgi:hypothetical protein